MNSAPPPFSKKEWTQLWGMKKSSLPKVRLFQKVVSPTAPPRSVPAAASRLTKTLLVLVLRHLTSGTAPGATPPTPAQRKHFLSMSNDTLVNAASKLFTSKAIVASMRELCFSALLKQPELRKMTGYSVADCSAAAATCDTMRHALWHYTTTRKIINCNNPGPLPCTQTFETQHNLVWNALASAICVKARIPLWVINHVPNVSAVYKTCLQCPAQLTESFVRRIGIYTPSWTEAFHPHTATKWAKSAPINVKAGLYLLVHARRHIRTLHLPPVATTQSDINAIVCVTCASLRSRAHNVPKPRRKTSGVILDVCNKTVRCGDCNSVHLLKVPLNRRAIVDASGFSTACAKCGALTLMTTQHGLCKRCSPPTSQFPCFCRTHPKFTTGVFLCTINQTLTLQGVCRRHAHAVPKSIEAIEVIADRANVRI